MAEWHLRVLKKARGLWSKESNEGEPGRNGDRAKTAELAISRGRQELRMGDVNSALTQFTEAKRYYRSVKLSALIVLLRLAPGLLRCLFRLRRMLLPPHGETSGWFT
jgi:hypothetical protein